MEVDDRVLIELNYHKCRRSNVFSYFSFDFKNVLKFVSPENHQPFHILLTSKTITLYEGGVYN